VILIIIFFKILIIFKVNYGANKENKRGRIGGEKKTHAIV